MIICRKCQLVAPQNTTLSLGLQKSIFPYYLLHRRHFFISYVGGIINILPRFTLCFTLFLEKRSIQAKVIITIFVIMTGWQGCREGEKGGKGGGKEGCRPGLVAKSGCKRGSSHPRRIKRCQRENRDTARSPRTGWVTFSLPAYVFFISRRGEGRGREGGGGGATLRSTAPANWPEI